MDRIQETLVPPDNELKLSLFNYLLDFRIIRFIFQDKTRNTQFDRLNCKKKSILIIDRKLESFFEPTESTEI